ncbi:MAG: hypothetical protein ACOCP4_04550 [Candidatus Woesearchaeota archaeon]
MEINQKSISVGIYKEEGKYRASLKEINNLNCSNKDKYCLGLAIAHTMEKEKENKLESLILNGSVEISDEEIEIIKYQIENSASYGGYNIYIKTKNYDLE